MICALEEHFKRKERKGRGGSDEGALRSPRQWCPPQDAVKSEALQCDYSAHARNWPPRVLEASAERYETGIRPADKSVTNSESPDYDEQEAVSIGGHSKCRITDRA
ncbi:MAG TPA: hypothetical protein VGV12_15680 [Gemmatimonadales bacterium]|nr:hypothetical protein [Gemmatimonadales bacterium]